MTREQQIRDFVAKYPRAPWWKRLPIIRHIRAAWNTRQINRHYEFWSYMGSLPTRADFDYAIRDAIWRGEK